MTDPQKNTHQSTIQVIEDEQMLCELLQEELSALGYRVYVALNGLDGLNRLQEIEPNVVICDRSMPAMTGYQLLERLRGVYPQYNHVPFIFLTAMTDTRDKHAVAHLNPFAYLEKPLDFNLLKETIRRALAGQG